MEEAEDETEVSARAWVSEISEKARAQGSVKLPLPQIESMGLARRQGGVWVLSADLRQLFHDRCCILWGPFTPRSAIPYCTVESMQRPAPTGG